MCHMQELALDFNKISDAGLTALAKAVESGVALAQLTTLGLGGNQIGDAGLSSLAAAVGNGALASLETLVVDDDEEHPALKVACQARGIDLQ